MKPLAPYSIFNTNEYVQYDETCMHFFQTFNVFDFGCEFMNATTFAISPAAAPRKLSFTGPQPRSTSKHFSVNRKLAYFTRHST